MILSTDHAGTPYDEQLIAGVGAVINDLLNQGAAVPMGFILVAFEPAQGDQVGRLAYVGNVDRADMIAVLEECVENARRDFARENMN